jgi:hypothetical protein
MPGSRAGPALAAMIAIGRPRNGCRVSPIEAPGFMGLPVVAWLAVPWPAGCRDRERVPAEPGAAAGRWRSRRRVCPSCPAGSGDDRHRAPPGTAVEFHRSRRLASRGWPWSRGWRCLGRPAAGIASDCRRNLAPLPAGGDRDAEFARSDRPAAPAMIVIGRHRERLSSLPDRGAWLHGVGRGPVVGSALAGRLPGSRATAGGTWRRYRQVAIETPSLPDLTGRLCRR